MKTTTRNLIRDALDGGTVVPINEGPIINNSESDNTMNIFCLKTPENLRHVRPPRFLTRTLYAAMILTGLGMIAVLPMFWVDPAAALFLESALLGSLAPLLAGVFYLGRGRGVIAWSVVFAVLAVLAGFGHLQLMVPVANGATVLVAWAALGLMLDALILSASVVVWGSRVKGRASQKSFTKPTVAPSLSRAA